MNLEIIKADLFTKPGPFAQCISADFGMGKGIALQFNKHFDEKNIMISTYGDWIAEFDNNMYTMCLKGSDNVYNLITKRNYWDKPTIENMRKALYNLKMRLISDKQNCIYMPKIGCGLDCLNWNDVEQLIRDILFSDTNINIVVCYL